jgi:hypothetical protein
MTRTRPTVTKTREPKLKTRLRLKVRQEKYEPIKEKISDFEEAQNKM